VSAVRMVSGALSARPKEIKPPIWAQVHARPARAAAVPAAKKSLLQPLYDAWQTGSEVLPGLGSGLLDIVRGELGKGLGRITLPLQAPPTPFNVEITGSRRFVAQSYSLERIKRIGAVAEATVNDVTLALCASALRQYLEVHDALPGKALTAMVPVSLHGETSKGGNQVGIILASLATDVADPVERLATIVASTSAAKKRLKAMSRVEKMAHAAMSLAPMLPGALTGGSLKRPVFNVVISNVPGPQETLYLNGARLDEAYPVSIPADYQALNITVSGNGDQLGFGFTACRRSVPGLQRMVDHIETALCELEAALLPATPRRNPRRKPAAAGLALRGKTAKS
jgi:diacylglycerol O-acyltransferase / wax synthase